MKFIEVFHITKRNYSKARLTNAFYIVAIFFLLLMPQLFFGQQYSFHFFNESEGLHYARHTNMVKDKQGYLWVGSHNGLRRYDGQKFITLGSGAFANIQLPFSDARKIFLLPNGLIAFLEQNKNLGVINPETFDYKQLQLDTYAKHDNRIVTVSQDADSMLYIYIQNPNGLSVIGYDGKQESIIYHKEQTKREMANSANRYENQIYLVSFDDTNYLFFDWQSGYFLLNKKTHELSPFELPESIAHSKSMPFFIIRDARGRWLFSFNTMHGIYILNKQGKLVSDTHFNNQTDYLYVIPTNDGKLIFSAYTKIHLNIDLYSSDNQQVERIENLQFDPWNEMEPWSDDVDHYLYVSGTAGFIFGETRDFDLTSYLKQAPGNSTGISIRGMAKISSEKMLVTTERNGTYIYNIKENSCNLLKSPSSWSDDLRPITFAKNLLSGHNGKIYLSAYAYTPPRIVPKGYLIVYDTIHGFESYHKLPFRIENMIWESDTSILAAVQSGLYRISLVPHIHVSPVKLGNQIKDLRDFFIEKMTRTDDGILLATNQGLFRIEDSGLKKIVLPGAETDHYYDIFSDDNGILWIGTHGDCLYRYDPNKDQLEKFNKKSGFNSDIVVGILPKDSTHLWVSTFNGVYLFNKKQQYARAMLSKNGIDQEEFNRYSYLKINDNDWLFGGMNGFIRIQQQQHELSDSKFRILFSSATFSMPGKVMDTTVYSPEQVPLLLSASDRKITLDFGFLNPALGFNPPIYYRLIPLGKKWVELPPNNELVLNYIPPGSYDLQLAFSDLQNPKQFPFKVQYFVYEHTWFKLLMGITVLLFLTFFIYLLFDRRLVQLKAKQLTENEYFRRRLFTYIVHEFKTPLTIIFGVSDKLWKSHLPKKWKDEISSVKKQSEAMNDLVVQMLELNQIEAGEWKPQLENVHIPEFLNQIVEQLRSLGDETGVAIKLEILSEQNVQRADAAKLRAVIVNLLNNAIKYSPEGETINVTYEVLAEKWMLTVRDHGPGIDKSDMAHLFDLFYKGTNHTQSKMGHNGVGLAYVKTAVEALNGKLEVYNDHGAVFQVTFDALHLDKEEFIENQQETTIITPEITEQEDSEKYQILIVEDNAEIAKFIKSCFSLSKFQTYWKQNGYLGLEFASEHIPDLIISDARMPEMDGFELVQKIKTDELTSHIPVIMLTALSAQSSRIKGLKAGADAYLQKPFESQELILSVENILKTIEKQKLLMASVLTRQNDNQERISESEVPDFVRKVNSCLEKNYNNSRFSTSEIAEELNMSRAQLQRKLKSVSGLNPSDMLRIYRLNKARDLLKDPSLSIAEIAFDCGFNDNSYFNKVFRKEFGTSPSVYRVKNS